MAGCGKLFIIKKSFIILDTVIMFMYNENC